MLYLLPTRGKAGYRGKYPNAIVQFSSGGTDKDGRKCAHWETNAGERFTCSYDRMNMPRCNEASRFIGLPWQTFVIGNTPVTTMSQAEYDVWLAAVRAKRGF